MSSEQAIDVVVRARDLTRDAFASIEAELAKLGIKLEDLGGAKSTGLTGGIKAFYKANEESFKAAGIAIAGIATGIATATAAVAALAVRGADVADIRSNFDALNRSVGNDSKEALGALKEAFAGTVSDFDLMKMTNKALGEGLKATPKDMGLIADAARVLSDRTGVDAAGAFETLTKAMATGKTKGAEMLVGVIENTKEYKTFAEHLGKTTAELTEQEKAAATNVAMMAKMHEVVNLNGKAQFDAADAWAAATVMVGNFKDSLAEAVAQSPVVSVMLNAFKDGMAAGFGGDQQQMVQTLTGYIGKFLIFLVDLASTGVSVAGVIGQAWAGLQLIFSGTLSLVSLAVLGVLEGIAQLTGAASKLPVVGDSFKGVADSARRAADFMGGVQKSFHDQAQEALEGVKGNSALQTSLDKVQGVIGGVRAKMVEASNAHVDLTEKTKSTILAHQALTETGGATNKMLDDLNKKLKEIGPELVTAFSHGATVSQILKTFGSDLEKIDEQVQLGMKSFNSLPTVVQKALTLMREDSIKSLETMKGTFEQAFASMAKGSEKMEQDITDAIGKGIELRVTAQAAYTKSSNELAILREQWAIEQAKKGFATRAELLPMETALLKHQLDIQVADRQAQFLEATRELNLQVPAQKDAYDKMKNVVDVDTALMTEKWRQEVSKQTATVGGFGSMFRGVLDGIPALLQQALTGGGGFAGFGKAISSQIGSGLGKELLSGGVGKAVTGGLSGLFGDSFGKAMGTILPGIGSALGALAGPLVNKIVGLFGPSADAKAALKMHDDWQAGIVANFAKIATAQELVEAGSENWKKVNITVRDAYLAVGKTGEEAMRDLATFHDATHQSADAVKQAEDRINATLDLQNKKQKDLNALFDTQKQKAQMVEAAVQRYGFTIEELGPTMRQQRLSEQAETLLDDFNLLTDSGIEIGTVTGRMKDKINEFLGAALRTGTEVPIAMQPMLAKMVEQGTLTDGNGKKLTDLSQIHFGETLTQGFQHIVDKLDELISKLSHVATGIDNIPDHVDTEINVNTNFTTTGEPPVLPDGGDNPYVDPFAGQQGFAIGGITAAPMSGQSVTVHGREAIIPLDRPSAIGQQFAQEAVRASHTTTSVDVRVDKIEAAVNRLVSTVQTMPAVMSRAYRDGMLLSGKGRA